MLEAAAEERGAGDEKKDQQEPSEKDHPPKQTFLLFHHAEGSACQNKTGSRAETRRITAAMRTFDWGCHVTVSVS
jgi:hypothetical protein